MTARLARMIPTYPLGTAELKRLVSAQELPSADEVAVCAVARDMELEDRCKQEILEQQSPNRLNPLAGIPQRVRVPVQPAVLPVQRVPRAARFERRNGAPAYAQLYDGALQYPTTRPVS